MLAAVQALVLAVLAVAEIVGLTPGRVTMAVTTSVFFLAYAVGLAVCVRGLLGLHSWARAPIVVTQLIQLGLAWNMRDHAWLPWLLAAYAVVVLVGVLHPRSIAALADDPHGEP